MNYRRQMNYSRYSNMRSVQNSDCGCMPSPEPVCSPICNTRADQDCDCRERVMNDPLQGMPLAMAYVPWQQFCNLYDEHEAFHDGTIFKDLDLDFYGRRCR